MEGAFLEGVLRVDGRALIEEEGNGCVAAVLDREVERRGLGEDALDGHVDAAVDEELCGGALAGKDGGV